MAFREVSRDNPLAVGKSVVYIQLWCSAYKNNKIKQNTIADVVIDKNKLANGNNSYD
jgi:hypothetical protein